MSEEPTVDAAASVAAAHPADGGLAAQRRGLDNTYSIHLEQMLGSLPVDCHFNTGTGFSFRKANPDGTTTYTHAYCNMMTCRTCAKRRCLDAAHAIREAIVGQQMLTHATFTLPPSTKDREQASKLARAHRRLLLNIADRVKHPFSYVWAYGLGTGGGLHLHLLTNAIRCGKSGPLWGVTKTWVKTRWHKLTGATQTRVTVFPPQDASKEARYLMKNVLETVLAGYRLPRRYGCSRDIHLVNTRVKAVGSDGDGGKWERVSGSSARHGHRLGVLEPNYGLNPTFTAPAKAEPGPPCEGTDVDWPDQEDGDDRSETGETETASASAGCREQHKGEQE